MLPSSTPPIRYTAPPQVPLLAPLTSQQRLALCTAFTTVAKAAGEGVIKKGEPGDTFYIIEEGSCVVVSDDGKVGFGAALGQLGIVRKGGQSWNGCRST